MASMKSPSSSLLMITLLLMISSLLLIVSAKPKPNNGARKSDIPLIKCQVCKHLAAELHQQVQKKESTSPFKKVKEIDVIEVSENMCSLKKEEADWITKMDIVRKGNALQLVEQEAEGQCNSQCKTIERACQEVMGYSDTDVAEYLFKSKPDIESLVNFLCNDLTDACSVKPPPVPKDWTPAGPFIPKAPKEAEMERLMKSMEGMPGAPNMKMYSRDDLMNNNFGKVDDDDEDEDDDTDDGDFSSKLEKALRSKETAKTDWKHKIAKRVSETKAVLKKYTNTVSRRLQQWWKGDKANGSSKPSKNSKAEF